jgi:hypothetical protein
MSSLLIRNGHLINPAAGIDAKKDFLLKDGRVAEIASPGKIKLGNSSEDAPILEQVTHGLAIRMAVVERALMLDARGGERAR